MLSLEDKEWLSKTHPALCVENGIVRGKVSFRASYCLSSNRFFLSLEGETSPLCGEELAGTFTLQIKEREVRSISKLPAVSVEEVASVPERHFSADGTACLGSPLEEEEFVEPKFSFQLFFERLVIPFLYGQLSYSLNGKWPWSEYAHGSTGLLESYASVTDPNSAADCLEVMSRDSGSWQQIRLLLLQKASVKGHTNCCCVRRDHFRRCHPRALTGLQKLRDHIKLMRIQVP